MRWKYSACAVDDQIEYIASRCHGRSPLGPSAEDRLFGGKAAKIEVVERPEGYL